MTQTQVPSCSHSLTRPVHYPGRPAVLWSLCPVQPISPSLFPWPIGQYCCVLEGSWSTNPCSGRLPRPREVFCTLDQEMLTLFRHVFPPPAKETPILDNSGNYFNIRTIVNWCRFFAFRFQQWENPSSDSLHASTSMHLLLKSIDWKLLRLFNWKQLRGIDNVPK